jgi:hypothetical protein
MASSSSSSVSLTSLLNSLHSHLQQQTQLLPTLHTQLGLPTNSLADELLALEKELTSCVERQIDLRRKQVDEWLNRCTQVEDECGKYAKALGTHNKVAGSGIGEFRKEQVLPKRFEALSEHQERLRQVSSSISILINYFSPPFSCIIPNWSNSSPSLIESTPCLGHWDETSTQKISESQHQRLARVRVILIHTWM